MHDAYQVQASSENQQGRARADALQLEHNVLVSLSQDARASILSLVRELSVLKGALVEECSTVGCLLTDGNLSTHTHSLSCTHAHTHTHTHTHTRAYICMYVCSTLYEAELIGFSVNIYEYQKKKDTSVHPSKSPTHTQKSPVHMYCGPVPANMEQTSVHPQKSPIYSETSPIYAKTSPIHRQCGSTGAAVGA